MATYATLTVTVRDIIGADFHESRASVWIEPNTVDGLILADGIRVGGRREQLVNGTATFANLVTTNSADNPTSFGYRVTISAPPKGASKREDMIVLTTSDFPLTENANLKDISAAWDNITIPPNWQSDFRDEMTTIREQAAASAALADSYIVADLNTSDGQMEALVKSPSSLTGAALRADFLPLGIAPPAPNTRRRWPQITMLSDVQGGSSEWVTGSPGRTNLSDTTDYIAGDRCITITTGGGGDNSDAQKYFSPPDLTGKGIVVWLKVQAGVDNLNYVNFAFTTATAGVRAALLTAYPGLGLADQIKAGEWFPVFLNRANFALYTGATMDWSAINSMRIDAQDRLGVSATVKLGGVGFYDDVSPTYPNGVVSFGFDDSFQHSWTVAYPHLSLYGYAATLYPIAELIGAPGYLAAAQARQMVSASGWEYGSHVSTVAKHVNWSDQTDEWVAEELLALRTAQAEIGLYSSAFAYPNGPYDLANIEQVTRNFASARGTNPFVHSTRAFDPQRIGSMVLSPAITLAAAKAQVDLAKSCGGWITFTVHDLVTSGGSGNQWTPSDFRALVDYIRTQGLAVAPVGDVVNAAATA